VPSYVRPFEGGQRRARRWPLRLAAVGLSLACALTAALVVGLLGDDPRRERLGPAAVRAGEASGGPASQLLAATDYDGRPASRPEQSKLKPYEQLIATAKRSDAGVEVYSEPGESKPELTIERREGQEGELVFAAEEQRGGWLEVMLPRRPNGSTGWIRERDVTLAVTDWSAKIDLTDHVLSVRKGGRTFEEWKIGIGQPDTPTPPGEYYITELIQPERPDTIYGPYVFVLSGFSEKLTNYAGGDGELGLHGTNDPTGLGSDVSHGCIRMNNEGITRLAQRLPLGTPLEIVE